MYVAPLGAAVAVTLYVTGGVPGLLFAANVAVCAPVVTELLIISAELPGSVPVTLSGVIPSEPEFSVSDIPEPPVFGAGIVSSPVAAILGPNALKEEVPTVESCEMYGSTCHCCTFRLLKNCTRYIIDGSR